MPGFSAALGKQQKNVPHDISSVCVVCKTHFHSRILQQVLLTYKWLTFIQTAQSRRKTQTIKTQWSLPCGVQWYRSTGAGVRDLQPVGTKCYHLHWCRSGTRQTHEAVRTDKKRLNRRMFQPRNWKRTPPTLLRKNKRHVRIQTHKWWRKWSQHTYTPIIVVQMHTNNTEPPTPFTDSSLLTIFPV